MDWATAVLFLKGKVDWQGSLLLRLRRARRDIATNGRIGFSASHDEIAVWENDGGAGDEVRR